MLYNGHSSSEQLDQLSRQPAGSGEPWAHIESCVQCRTTLEKYRKLNVKLDQLAANGVRSTSTMNCPDERIWLEVAAGTLSPEESLSYSSHAATCDACAKRLQAAIRILAPEVTEEEERMLDSLPSFDKETLVGLPKESAVPVEPIKPPKSDKKALRRSFWRPLSYGFAGIAVLMIVGFLSLGLITDNLLARGYTQKGTLEYRIAKASPPKEGTRGPSLSMERSTSLVLADLFIKFRLAISPQSPHWLGEKGRLQLIEGDESSAVKTLEQAHSLDSKSKQIAIDMASAYARTGSKDLLFKAEELLLSVLPLEKDNPDTLRGDSDNLEALYNLAIVYELTGSASQAQEAWGTYLQIDPSGKWADEARRRRANLQHRKRGMKNPQESALSDWQAYLKSGAPNASEEALSVATQNWLPHRRSLLMAINGPPDLENILYTTSDLLKSEHGDHWLGDVVAIAPSALTDRGFQDLQGAIRFNMEGKFESGINAAVMAQEAFRLSGNAAGLARAQLEEIYSYQRSTKAESCLRAVQQLENTISQKSYTWILAQLYLDKASCLNMLGLLEQAKKESERADFLAIRSKYNILALRAIGIVASQATTRGDHALALTQDTNGLSEYWMGQYPIERAYQFYSDITFNAEALSFWHVAFDTGQEAVRIISQTSRKELEAAARYRLAKAAVMLSQNSFSNKELQAADLLFTSLPQTHATTVYRIDQLLGIAHAHVHLGEPDSAMSLLQRLANNLPTLESQLIVSRLNLLKGNLALKAGDIVDAHIALQAAVSIAESSLMQLSSPEDRLAWAKNHEESYKALIQLKMDQNDLWGALEVWEGYKSAIIRHQRLSFPPSTNVSDIAGADFQLFLRSGAPRLQDSVDNIFISYAFLPKGLVVWIMDKKGLDSRYLQGDLDNMRKRFLNFATKCANSQSNLDDLLTDARDLYNILILPFQDHLVKGSVITIESEEEISLIPFEALIDKTGTYLVNKFTFIYSPGIVFQQYLRPVYPLTRNHKGSIVGYGEVASTLKNLLTPLPSVIVETTTVQIS